MEVNRITIDVDQIGDTTAKRIDMSVRKPYAFIEELHGKVNVLRADRDLSTACDTLHELMLDIQKTQPEYYDKIMRIRRDMIGLKIDLAHQYDGFICYAK